MINRSCTGVNIAENVNTLNCIINCTHSSTSFRVSTRVGPGAHLCAGLCPIAFQKACTRGLRSPRVCNVSYAVLIRIPHSKHLRNSKIHPRTATHRRHPTNHDLNTQTFVRALRIWLCIPLLHCCEIDFTERQQQNNISALAEAPYRSLNRSGFPTLRKRTWPTPLR